MSLRPAIKKWSYKAARIFYSILNPILLASIAVILYLILERMPPTKREYKEAVNAGTDTLQKLIQKSPYLSANVYGEVTVDSGTITVDKIEDHVDVEIQNEPAVSINNTVITHPDLSTPKPLTFEDLDAYMTYHRQANVDKNVPYPARFTDEANAAKAVKPVPSNQVVTTEFVTIELNKWIDLSKLGGDKRVMINEVSIDSVTYITEMGTTTNAAGVQVPMYSEPIKAKKQGQGGFSDTKFFLDQNGKTSIYVSGQLTAPGTCSLLIERTQ